MERTYRSPVFGDWSYAEDCGAWEDNEWRQTKLLSDSHSIRLRIKARGFDPPALTHLALTYHVVEKQSFFLKAFVYWGRMALYDMGVMPEDISPQSSFLCELKVSEVLARSECLLPFYQGPESEYEIHARHPVHAELEFRSRWRGLETIGVDVRWQREATMFDRGRVCLLEGTFREKLDRALALYDKLNAARDVVSRASAKSRSS